MKLLRLFIVMLLVVVVPLRGIAAAVMPCHGETAPAHVHVEEADSEEMSPSTMEMHHADMHAHDAVEVHDHHEHDGSGHADKCNLCDTCCGASALPSTPLVEFEASAPVVVRFPDLTMPAPTDFQGGQERPPRSI